MRTARLLIVEDDRASAELLLRALGQAGHLGHAAESAEDAAALLTKNRYDLVLLDHVLPGETGMQALGRLRTLSRAPIHLMSGYTDDDTRRDALLLGATGFLPKPVDIARVKELIAALPERSGDS